ncbi:SCO-spondin-like [Macrobrachium nipponense]|uniref:SCO-spondin-like n=1 Tax=Macrobrachium nipponense TaxID=159736 RepID=UPI0030C88C6A
MCASPAGKYATASGTARKARTSVNASATVGDQCEEGHYSCPTGSCLPPLSVCDRKVDCADGDDEKHCLDDNFDIRRYISVKPSPVSGAGRWGKFASRLVTPPLSHPAGGVAFCPSSRLDGPGSAPPTQPQVTNLP